MPPHKHHNELKQNHSEYRIPSERYPFFDPQICNKCLFKVDKPVVTCVSGLIHNPLPFFGHMKGAAG